MVPVIIQNDIIRKKFQNNRIKNVLPVLTWFTFLINMLGCELKNLLNMGILTFGIGKYFFLSFLVVD